MSLALPEVIVEDIRVLATRRGYPSAEITRHAIILGLSMLRGPERHPTDDARSRARSGEKND
jgi:hypothetical protein